MNLIFALVLLAFCGAQPGTLQPKASRDSQALGFRAYGYKGPASLGPFRINNQAAGTPLKQLLADLGLQNAPSGDRLCFKDESSRTYLILAKGSDDPLLVRGVSLSRFQNCFDQPIYATTRIKHWATERGILLGSTEAAVIAAYGKPTEVASAKHNRRIFFPGYQEPTPAILAKIPSGDFVLQYIAKADARDLSLARFGIVRGRVVWIEVSHDE